MTNQRYNKPKHTRSLLIIVTPVYESHKCILSFSNLQDFTTRPYDYNWLWTNYSTWMCEWEYYIIIAIVIIILPLGPITHPTHITQVWAPTKLLFQQGLNKLAGTGIVGLFCLGCEDFGGSNLLTWHIPHRGKAESTAMDPVLNEFCCDKRDGFVSTKRYTYIYTLSWRGHLKPPEVVFNFSFSL